MSYHNEIIISNHGLRCFAGCIQRRRKIKKLGGSSNDKEAGSCSAVVVSIVCFTHHAPSWEVARKIFQK